MRVTAWLRSPSIRRRLIIGAVLVGCFVWAMVIVGLSFAMVERGSGQWWVLPLFGAFVLAIAVLAVRWVPAAPPRADVAPASLAIPVAAQGPPPVAVQRKPAEPLSPRELEVLHHLATGRTNAEIAKALFVATGTVKAHLNHIFRKLDAASRLQAVAHAREAGLLE
ncbi:response regulator transcription factor [Micromonospora ureilytica]|uniref:helix-turn-helix transcriptional regulator n=1 Tax=Micromonospora ureilytica TaxID=709868 RepID=UPI002E12ACA0|nr:response regulator transcription factor [Micromonospora ureilytica]